MSNKELEHDLLREAQDGDLEAYEDLQLLLERPIYRFVGRLMNYNDAVDDIVQDVFIAFYQNLNKIDPVENLRPYIYRIARNRVYDELRIYQRGEILSLDEEPIYMRVSYTEATTPQPDDVTHWVLLELEVQEAIDQLPENQRQALIMYAEEEMTYAEIADIMEVSIGTIKSRIYYAKRNLRQYLRPETLQSLAQEFGDEKPTERKIIDQPIIKEEQDERILEPQS